MFRGVENTTSEWWVTLWVASGGGVAGGGDGGGGYFPLSCTVSFSLFYFQTNLNLVSISRPFKKTKRQKRVRELRIKFKTKCISSTHSTVKLANSRENMYFPSKKEHNTIKRLKENSSNFAFFWAAFYIAVRGRCQIESFHWIQALCCLIHISTSIIKGMCLSSTTFFAESPKKSSGN